MQRSVTTIAFDADDTLWQNMTFYTSTEARFADLLKEHAEPAHLSQRLLAAEKRNLAHYGYGIKGFTLSMIETAIEVTSGKVPAEVIRDILEAGREMLNHPIEPLPRAEETLRALHGEVRLMMITKGDLFDQERKLAQSGLGDYFDAVEIVSEKSPETYDRVFRRHGDGAARSMMVGNSLRSDVLPALAVGSWGVHVPHSLTWVMEHAEAPKDAERFREVADLGGVPPLVRLLDH